MECFGRRKAFLVRPAFNRPSMQSPLWSVPREFQRASFARYGSEEELRIRRSSRTAARRRVALSAWYSAQISASRYVHRRAIGDGADDYFLDVADGSNQNYLRWVADLCAPYLGNRVLDVGAGFGTITEPLAVGRDMVALEVSETCCLALRERFRSTPNVHVVQGDLTAIPADDVFDSIVMTNVLEHIYDDAGILAALRHHLCRGGNVLLYVPALNGYFTAWDRNVGHYRRYSRRRLAGVVSEAGLKLNHLRYINLLGLAGWPFSGRMLKVGDSAAGSLSLWDRHATPLTRALERRVRIPIGLNLFCVAENPE
jgi:2-polyprenyl-3-methyl-5-hydroxy-6-metoxy-1,4-benzoquinol methylase